jgi:steroid delta-isomerase
MKRPFDPIDHPVIPIQRIARLFSSISPADIPHLADHYCEDAEFVDPFNAVHGIAPIRQIFEHMFARLENPRFDVLTAIGDADEAMLTWDFRFRFRNSWLQHPTDPDQRIHGATRLVFAPDGRVCLHRDYWDAAAEFYEKLPLIGPVMRRLRQAGAAPIPPCYP